MNRRPQIKEFRWWELGIIYQIYPRSFKDSNGDGIGDLRGIQSKLEYLQWLGVDAIWISPIFPSPMADFGYDVSNYTDIDPIFGTLEDFDELLADVHRRGMKLLLDYVPNHTAERHPWFIESRASRTNAKRDWYIWRDSAPGGSPPNNWRAYFGASAWERDEQTGQYFYHAFLKEQPDLNWRNPEVRQTMLNVLRFWLERDVDGFRIDAVHHLVEDLDLRDNPPNPNWHAGMSPYRELLTTHTVDLPEVQEMIGLMCEVVEEYGNRLLVSEVNLPVERSVAYYAVKSAKGAHLPFNFQLIRLPWNAKVIGQAVERYEGLLPANAWPNWVLGNHDRPRIATRAGTAQARVAALLLLTLRGTPTMYLVRDPFEKNLPGLGLGRDPVRTPMQWTDGPWADFSTAQPWLPLADDFMKCNVSVESDDASSLLALYHRLIQLRRTEPALSVGDYSALPSGDDVMAYIRKASGRWLLIVLNFGAPARSFNLNDLRSRAILLLSTRVDREQEELGGEVSLLGNEGVLVALS